MDGAAGRGRVGVGRPSPGENRQARPAEAPRGPQPTPQDARSGVAWTCWGCGSGDHGRLRAGARPPPSRTEDERSRIAAPEPSITRVPIGPLGTRDSEDVAPNSRGSGTRRDSVITHHSLGDRALSWRKDTSVPTHSNGGGEAGDATEDV